MSLDSLNVVDMAPAEGQAALAQGAVDMACGWGGALRRMVESGNILLTGAEKEELGILVFDVTTAPSGFVAENPDVVAKFLSVTASANDQWAAGQPGDMLTAIAKDAGMSEEDTLSTMATFEFPGVEDQLSGKWLSGGAQSFMKGVAEVFVEAGSIDAAKDSYVDNVNSGPLTAAKDL